DHRPRTGPKDRRQAARQSEGGIDRSRPLHSRDGPPFGGSGARRGRGGRASCVCLAVVGAAVSLADLELMVTPVALPSILADLADPTLGSAWVELRKASWIINGYLLGYILTMPMAGRLADLWGARRLFLGALVVFIVGSALAGA